MDNILYLFILEFTDVYNERQQIMIHLQNTDHQIMNQKQHHLLLGEDIPDHLTDKIKEFQIMKYSLQVCNHIISGVI